MAKSTTRIRITATRQAPPANISTDHPLATIRKRPLAAYLGVSPWTLDRWRKVGQFPQPIKIGAKILVWRVHDIELWLMQRQLSEPTPRVQVTLPPSRLGAGKSERRAAA